MRAQEPDGGLSIGIGTWFQATGATAEVLADWRFVSAEPTFEGEALVRLKNPPTSVALECFDMDAAIFEGVGVTLAQFKVSAQRRLRGGSATEVHDILKSASNALLQLREREAVDLANFLVISNRPGWKALEALQSSRACSNVAEFATLPVPHDLKGKRTSAANLGELASSIMEVTRKRPNSEEQGRIDTCLEIMWRAGTRQVKQGHINEVLRTWLFQWGFLASEHQDVINYLVGCLVNPAGLGIPVDPDDLIRRRLGVNATRLNHISLSARARQRVAEATNQAIPVSGSLGPPEEGMWRVPRGSIAGQIDAAIRASDRASQLLILFGPGGVGKSAILYDVLWGLCSHQASAEEIKTLPLNRRPLPHFPTAIEEGVRNIARFDDQMTPVETRLRVANGDGDGCYLCVGVDGLDEVSDDTFRDFLDSVAQYVSDTPETKVIMTCRSGRLIQAQGILREKLWQSIQVDALNENEVLEALATWTGTQLEESDDDPTFVIPAGDRIASPSVWQTAATARVSDDPRVPTAILRSLTQPLMLGVARGLRDQADGEALLVSAIRGESPGIDALSSSYVRHFCIRTASKLNRANVHAGAIFHVLQYMVDHFSHPNEATSQDWEQVCRISGPPELGWIEFYRQLEASGFIVPVGRMYAFDWRHPFVVEHLKIMPEPSWS